MSTCTEVAAGTGAIDGTLATARYCGEAKRRQAAPLTRVGGTMQTGKFITCHVGNPNAQMASLVIPTISARNWWCAGTRGRAEGESAELGRVLDDRRRNTTVRPDWKATL
jgi:hypothetical protein